MAHSTGWNAGGTGKTQEAGVERIPRGRDRAGLMADLTPEGEQPLGMGLMAVALMAGIVGLSSGWFGAPPVSTTGIVRASHSLLLDPGSAAPPGRETRNVPAADLVHVSAVH